MTATVLKLKEGSWSDVRPSWTIRATDTFLMRANGRFVEDPSNSRPDLVIIFAEEEPDKEMVLDWFSIITPMPEFSLHFFPGAGEETRDEDILKTVCTRI